ncbi:MAG: hypothetical protein ACKESB_03510 [Candidatus Hodgkinia cicadicola]
MLFSAQGASGNGGAHGAQKEEEEEEEENPNATHINPLIPPSPSSYLSSGRSRGRWGPLPPSLFPSPQPPLVMPSIALRFC